MLWVCVLVLWLLKYYIYDVHMLSQEYGVTREEKLAMAEIICTPLLNKMQSDLHHVLSNESSDINHRLDPQLSKHIVISPSRHVRTRLYFTSESHIHCLINILRYSRLFGVSHKLFFTAPIYNIVLVSSTSSQYRNVTGTYVIMQTLVLVDMGKQLLISILAF